MANYPDLETPVQPIFSADQVAAAEEAMRRLAVTDAILHQCEVCKIPVGEIRKECDGLCEWYQNFIAQHKGQQSALPQALG